MYQNLANLTERHDFRAVMESVDKLVLSGVTATEHADSEMTDIDDSASKRFRPSFFLTHSTRGPALTTEFPEGDTEVEDDMDSEVNQYQSPVRGLYGDLDSEDYRNTQTPA